MAFAKEVVRPLEQLADSVNVFWPKSLTPELKDRILYLTNTILEREDTIGFAGPLDQVQGKQEMDALAESVAGGDKSLLLLQHKENQEIVGHLILSQSKLPNCQHIGEISRAMVHPNYRGFSAILLGMYEVLNKCADIGVDIIQLDVRANTRIHRLWEGLGFKTIGLMEDYARVNGNHYSGCFMYQHVDQLRDRFLNSN